MMAVNWPARMVADTLSSAYAAASPAPYVLLTPTARAALVDVAFAVVRLDVVVTDMALLERLAAWWQRGLVRRRRRGVLSAAGSHADDVVHPSRDQRRSVRLAPRLSSAGT